MHNIKCCRNLYNFILKCAGKRNGKMRLDEKEQQLLRFIKFENVAVLNKPGGKMVPIV